MWDERLLCAATNKILPTPKYSNIQSLGMNGTNIMTDYLCDPIRHVEYVTYSITYSSKLHSVRFHTKSKKYEVRHSVIERNSSYKQNYEHTKTDPPNSSISIK